MCLKDLKPGDSAVIRDIELEGNIKSRLMAMGLVRGAKVKMMRIAPLGDPIQIKVMGYNLSFRKCDAKHIKVDVV